MKNCVVNAVVMFTAAFIFLYSSFILATDVELSPLGAYSSLAEDSEVEIREASLVEQFREQFKKGEVPESDIVKLKAALDPQYSGPTQEVMPLSAPEELTPQKKPLLGEAQASYSEKELSVADQLLEQIANKQLTIEDLVSLRESLGLPNHLPMRPEVGDVGLPIPVYPYRYSANSGNNCDCDCCTCDERCCWGMIIGVSISILTGMPHH